MREIANSTGGTAFYNDNGLDKIAAHWLDNGGSFYTLTYSPKDFRFDNKWHTVKVKLSAELSGYTLSYRRGYFADATTAARQKEQNTQNPPAFQRRYPHRTRPAERPYYFSSARCAGI